MQMEDFIIKARKALNSLPHFSSAECLSTTPLAGDASARSYIRLNLNTATPPSVILMILSAGSGPIAGGDSSVSQSNGFVILNQYLAQAGLPVPEIFFDGRSEGFLLVEDVDDFPLWRLALGELKPEQSTLVRRIGGTDPGDRFFRQAIDLLSVLQALPPDSGCPAFQRHLSFAEYRSEAQRFVDLCLVPHGFASARLKPVELMLDELCRSIDAHPRALCYRDYMAWNIMIDPGGNLRLLDYQDLLLASTVYDVASLLNDRDTDSALGRERWLELVNYARARLKAGTEFEKRLLECSLQRDLRLAGQFWNLSQARGKPQYERWVPGCLRRIGRSLAGLQRWPEVLEELCEFSPEVKAGVRDPWLVA